MFKRLVIAVLMVMVLCFSVQAAPTGYEFYHVAVRDYNGDGLVNNGDHIRYGFTGVTGTATAKLYAASNPTVALQEKTVGGTWAWKDSKNGGAWTDMTYRGAKFDYSGVPAGAIVKLFDDTGVEIASHNVSIPTFPLPASYNGYDPNSLSWEWNNDGDLAMSWDPVSFPVSPPDYTHRFIMEANVNGTNYSFFNSMSSDDTTGFLFDGDLFNDGGINLLDGVMWEVHFEQRFLNPVGGENFNWLRSYSESVDCDLSVDGSPVPIPGSVLLLGSGMLGLIGIRRRKR